MKKVPAVRISADPNYDEDFEAVALDLRLTEIRIAELTFEIDWLKKHGNKKTLMFLSECGKFVTMRRLARFARENKISLEGDDWQAHASRVIAEAYLHALAKVRPRGRPRQGKFKNGDMTAIEALKKLEATKTAFAKNLEKKNAPEKIAKLFLRDSECIRFIVLNERFQGVPPTSGQDKTRFESACRQYANSVARGRKILANG
jgi:hypothetical protein